METPTPNRFAPPVAVVDDVASGVQPIRLWPPSGRIGRLRFFAYGVSMWLLVSIFAGVLGFAIGVSGARADLLPLITGLVYIVAFAAIAIQRSHDMNLSGWMSLLLIIPFVSLVWMFKRGTQGSNRFGAPPPPNSTMVVVVGWVAAALLALFVVGIVAAIAIPALHLSGASSSAGTR